MVARLCSVTSLALTEPTVLPAAHDGDAVGNFQHFGQLVGDEDDGAALRDQRADGDEELVDLLRRQHGGRLVENEDAGVAIERLEDLDALLLARRAAGRRAAADRLRGGTFRTARAPCRSPSGGRSLMPVRGSEPSTTFS